MRILLIGEYSRLHNSLKEGLVSLGHDVTIAADGDQFKNYPVDIELKVKYTDGIMLLIRRMILEIFKQDITSISLRRQFHHKKHLLKDYDIVQLINENAIGCTPKIETELLTYVFTQNKNSFLLSCGNDYISVNHAFEKKVRYSVLTALFEGKVTAKDFNYSLKYITKPYKHLHTFILKHVKGVIATDFDYHIPLEGHHNYLGLIPNPINIDRLKYIEPNVSERIIIFHGVNKMNYYKKGNDIFDEALEIIQTKFPDKVDIRRTESLPYDTYIKIYDACHILLDQVYSFDQGYNALEAMAKGKVVFTGAEQEWLDCYDLEADTVAINALPDAQKIAEKLEWLILNPEKISEISKNARAFIEREHDYLKVAEMYLETWVVNL